MGLVARRIAPHDDHVIRNRDLETHVKQLSRSMLAVRPLDHDTEARDPRLEARETLAPLADVGFEGRAWLHIAKRDVDGKGHTRQGCTAHAMNTRHRGTDVARFMRMPPTSSPRVLVAYGTERRGTAEIAEAIAKVLRERGAVVDCLSADRVRDVSAYDAFVIGGALYMARWHRHARRFVARFAPALRERPTWLFSSGPLDDSAANTTIPPVRGVARWMRRIGARGHMTFGGRLASDARGFIAAAMAKKNSGDWRDHHQIQTWAEQLATAIETAPRARPAAVTPTRWILATLCLVVGVSAVLGGLALAIRPDGSLLQMPTSVLDHTMFASFLAPGLLLAGVIGAWQLVTAALVIRQSEHADLAGLLAGGSLTLWIVAQMFLLRSMNALQLATLAVASWEIAESLRRLSMYRPTTATT